MSMEPCALAKTCLMDLRCADYQQCVVERDTEAHIRADECAKVAEQIARRIDELEDLDYETAAEVVRRDDAARIAREVGRG